MALKTFLSSRVTLRNEERLPATLAISTLEDADTLDGSPSVCVTRGREKLSELYPVNIPLV